MSNGQDVIDDSVFREDYDNLAGNAHELKIEGERSRTRQAESCML